LFLVAIVFIVVLKDTLNWLYWRGRFDSAEFFELAVRIYRKMRVKKETSVKK